MKKQRKKEDGKEKGSVKMKNKRNNKHLRKAQFKKDDEFYTRYEDVEEELKHYKKFLKNKIVYCNTDDPEHSNFWKFFINNFKDLRLKGLISTFYNEDGASYKTYYDGTNISKTKLRGNGDFRSKECLDIMNGADIIITNPPFSLFREFIKALIDKKKDFLIIGNYQSITCKIISKQVVDETIKIGYSSPKQFIRPSGEVESLGFVCWYTSLSINKETKPIKLTHRYDPEIYKEYDNYYAIEVPRVSMIPSDYDGVMGVPITYLKKHNPDQFKILGFEYQIKDTLYNNLIKKSWDGKIDKTYLNGKRKYARLFIKKV